MTRISAEELNRIAKKMDLGAVKPIKKKKTKTPIKIVLPKDNKTTYDFQLGDRNGYVRIVEPDSISTPIRDRIGNLAGRFGFSGGSQKPSKTDFGSGYADGKVGSSKQGQRGDCYFLASINAIRNSKDGQEIFKKNLKYNSDGSITVTLPGAVAIRNHYLNRGMKRCEVTGVYRITQEALQKAIGNAGRSYSAGDLEVIALEIAMENYRAEMVATTQIYGKSDNREHSPEAQINHLDDRDYLSGGWSYDATFLLTGQKAEVYQCSANKSKNSQLYQDGKHGYITVEEMNRQTKYNLRKEYGTLAKGRMSEVTHVTNRDSDLQRMLDKYQGHEKDFALTFSVRVAKKGPDGHTKAGGLHEITVVKITDSTVYIANPWHPDKIEPIPRNEFERMATSFSATPMKKNNVDRTYIANGMNDLRFGVNQPQTDTLNQTLMNIMANKFNHREGGTTISSERFSQYLEQFNKQRPSSQRLNANTLIRRLNNAAKMNLNQEQLDFINRLYSQMTTKGDIKISDKDRKILASLSRRQ